MDNNEKTSWMILFSQGTGLCIEAWKITKAVGQSLSSFSPCVFSNDETDSLRCRVDVAVVPATVGFLPYTLSITDKHVLSEEELKTQEYDQLAFRWVSYVRRPVSSFFLSLFLHAGCGQGIETDLLSLLVQVTIPTLVGYTIYSMVYNEHRGWYSFVISTLTSFV